MLTDPTSECGKRLKTSLSPLLAALACLITAPVALLAANTTIWDAASRFGDTPNLEDKSGWKAVPSDLLDLESDPVKAASDPGYYGREFVFKGDAVVENARLTAVFWSAKGRVVLYAKDIFVPSGASSPDKGLGRKIVELAPLQDQAQPTKISRCDIVRNGGDEVVLEVSFSANTASESTAVFSFGKTELVEIKPLGNMQGVSLFGPVEYGIAPGFIGDDLVFSAAELPSLDMVDIPARNLFVGLLPGESSEWVMAWPKGDQRLSLRLGKQPDKRRIESIDFRTAGRSLYLAGISAPGIWHKERLSSSFLEKDVAVQWKPPFPAKWTTQLFEGTVKTGFAFRQYKGQIWRGVPGSYQYPVWFDGDTAYYHLSKKIPPKGESVVYFLEGSGTPSTVQTPVDLMKAALGRELAGEILDVSGRKLRTHHRRFGDGVRRACTCGCTEAIQAVFNAGAEVEKKDYIDGAANDMLFFVQCHVARIGEYKQFAADLLQFLSSRKGDSPALKAYIENLESIASQIIQEHEVQQENMKSVEYAKDLVRQTVALADKKAPENDKACAELVKAWTSMGGAQDYVLAQCHTLVRKLSQAAGYGCLGEPGALALAEAVRERCRQCLRNPDGYEIWADY